MAERDVIYRLKAIYDTSGSQAFAAMASQHAATLKNMEDRWKAYDATLKTAAGSQADAVGRSYQKQKDSAKQYYDLVAAENKKLVDAIKERERAEELARRTQERAFAQARAGNAMMREGLMNTAEGVTRVVRGLTLMGFVSDENLQKLLKTLAAVQGTSDLILGSVKAYSALQKAVDGYTMAVQAARTAEAARAGVAAGGAAAGVGGAGGGVGAAGLVAGGAAAAAAIAGVSFALAELAETANGTALDIDSFTSATGRWIENFNRWVNESTGGAVAKSEPFNEARRDYFSARKREDEASSQRQYQRDLLVGPEAERMAAFNRSAGIGSGASKVGLIDAEMTRVRGRYAKAIDGAGQTFGQDRMDLHGEAVKAQERLLELTQLRASEEDRIRQTSVNYHQTAISAAQQELAILRQQQEADAGRLESARDRFGMMSTMEQDRALRLGRLANQANQLRASGREGEARRIEDRFTRDDLGIIRGIGTEGTDAFGGRVAGERAERRGFSGVFGGEERKRMSELAPRIESLIAETTINVEARFKLELDIEQARDAMELATKPIIETMNRLGAEFVKLKADFNKSNRDAANTAARARQGG
jgi:hypothetical protein